MYIYTSHCIDQALPFAGATRPCVGRARTSRRVPPAGLRCAVSPSPRLGCKSIYISFAFPTSKASERGGWHAQYGASNHRYCLQMTASFSAASFLMMCTSTLRCSPSAWKRSAMSYALHVHAEEFTCHILSSVSSHIGCTKADGQA
jgi:hypothetical protein